MIVPIISLSKSPTSDKVYLVVDGDTYNVKNLEISYSPDAIYPTVKITISGWK